MPRLCGGADDLFDDSGVRKNILRSSAIGEAPKTSPATQLKEHHLQQYCVTRRSQSLWRYRCDLLCRHLLRIVRLYPQAANVGSWPSGCICFLEILPCSCRALTFVKVLNLPPLLKMILESAAQPVSRRAMPVRASSSQILARQDRWLSQTGSCRH